MTKITMQSGTIKAIPDEGMRLYNSTDKVVADAEIYLPSDDAIDQWEEITEEKAEIIKSDLEAAQSGTIPDSVMTTDSDGTRGIKEKFNRICTILGAKASATALVALLPFISSGQHVEYTMLDDVLGTDTVVTDVNFDGLAKTNDVDGLSKSVSALWTYAYGNSVWIAVTNYLRTVDGVAPSLGLWEVRDGKTNLVYSTADEITNATAKTEAKLTSSFQNGINSLRKEIPSTAWSRYQSMSGAPNPASNDVTVISTPLIMLTGGAEWTQYVDVSSNSLWVLSSRGTVVPTVDTNGYFRIYDSEGKTAFEVVQEQAMIVDALPAASPSMSEGVMTVIFRANAQPILYTSPDLKTEFMEEGTDDNCTVAWANNNDGTYTATVSFVDVLPQYFAFAKYTKPGKTVIRNTAPVSMSGGIMLDDGTRIKPEVSGGVVSWKVVSE